MRARRVRLLWVGGVAVVTAIVVATAIATGGRNFRGHLEGYSEVPAVSTNASGSFTARLAPGGEAVDYTLTYRDLEADATQAHIHFGQKDVAAGISVWLCSNLASPPTPPGTQACPVRGGTVTGTFDADDVVGPTAQGIEAGELDELLRAIRSGVAYVNVHSTKFPGGEIRAPLRRGRHGD